MTTHDFATTDRSPGDLDALSLGVHELLLGAPPVRTDARPHSAPIVRAEQF